MQHYFIGLLLVMLMPFSSQFAQITSDVLPDKVEEGMFLTRQGGISFRSDAPMELIEATSDLLYGILDTTDRSFAFSVTVLSFEGFNSPLQRTHFNENYLESRKHPKATFIGKIVEDLDFSKEGVFSVRAKGELTIHGVTQSRIIKGLLKIQDNQLIVVADFNVLLEEHDIGIPQIVHQKIAESIRVQLSASLSSR